MRRRRAPDRGEKAVGIARVDCPGMGGRGVMDTPLRRQGMDSGIGIRQSVRGVKD